LEHPKIPCFNDVIGAKYYRARARALAQTLSQQFEGFT